MSSGTKRPASRVEGGEPARRLRLSSLLALTAIAFAIAPSLHAGEVTRLQWGGTSSAPAKKSTSSSTALRFVKPAVGSSSHDDSNIKLAAWESSDAPRLTSGREVEPQTRSVIVNRDDDSSSDNVRSAQLPSKDPSGGRKVDDGLRSPFTDNAEPPQPNPLPMPESGTNLPMPEDNSNASQFDKNAQQLNQNSPASNQPRGQFQPILPSGPSASEQSPPLPAPNPNAFQAEGTKAKESCEKSLENLRKYTVDKVNLNIAIRGTEGEDFPFECTIDDGTMHPGRCWEQTTYLWKASAMCHKPLYFEDEQVERYGHSFSPCIQPFASGAHFFCTLPVLPYCMGVEPPCECIYALGHYRPGDCAPYMCNPIPLSLRGALFEGGAVVGAAAAIP